MSIYDNNGFGYGKSCADRVIYRYQYLCEYFYNQYDINGYAYGHSFSWSYLYVGLRRLRGCRADWSRTA
jgi:hypothetical protein